MNAFDDQQEDKTNTIPSKDIPEYKAYKRENPHVSIHVDGEGTLQDKGDHLQADPLSVDKLENFSEQKGVVGIPGSTHNDAIGSLANAVSTLPSKRVQAQLGGNEKILKNGFKVIKFSNNDSEYDLDENFIFAGTYARAVLVGTVIASAGIGASANPEPVMLRINDTGNLPNNIKGFLKDAIVIGAAYGDLSSESVIIRLERIVKIDNKTGVGVDIPVKGYVAGENAYTTPFITMFGKFYLLC